MFKKEIRGESSNNCFRAVIWNVYRVGKGPEREGRGRGKLGVPKS